MRYATPEGNEMSFLSFFFLIWLLAASTRHQPLTVENHSWIKDPLILHDLILGLSGLLASLARSGLREIAEPLGRAVRSSGGVPIRMLVRQDIVLGAFKICCLQFYYFSRFIECHWARNFWKGLITKEPLGWVRLFQEQENERRRESRKKHAGYTRAHHLGFVLVLR